MSLGLLVIIVLVFLIPEDLSMPVSGATNKNYNSKSFWYYPWGKSVTHKGVDIFAKEGTKVVSSTKGIVIYRGELKRGGNVVLILSPKLRLHYYAHLKEIKTGQFSIQSAGETIATVGTTGNAAGKPPHLHYSIITELPYLWRLDRSIQGWKKIFYLNPIDYLMVSKPS